MEWLNAFTAGACALSAVLAWIAKILWSKEFAAAKDEIIKAKDAQIALVERENLSLKELTPMRIREYFVSVKDQLEEFIEALKKQLLEAKKEIEKRDSQIAELVQHGGAQAEEIRRLEVERMEIVDDARKLEIIKESSITNRDEIWKHWVTLQENMATVKAAKLEEISFLGLQSRIGRGFKSTVEIIDSNKNNSGVAIKSKGERIASNKNNP